MLSLLRDSTPVSPEKVRVSDSGLTRKSVSVGNFQGLGVQDQRRFIGRGRNDLVSEVLLSQRGGRRSGGLFPILYPIVGETGDVGSCREDGEGRGCRS